MEGQSMHQSPDERIAAMHEEIDAAVRSLERRHIPRLHCRKGCAACCVDDITVWAVEAAHIRIRCADTLALREPHPVGACAFLDGDGSCRISLSS